MTRAQTILAALAAADLAEERGDYDRAAAFLGQAEAAMLATNKTLIGVAPPARGSAPRPLDERERSRRSDAGRYSVVQPGRYQLVRRPR